MLLPLPFSFYYGDTDYYALIYSSLICFLLGGIGYYFLPKIKQDIRSKEGFAIVTFGWIIFALFGSFPFLFSGSCSTLTDAFFETMSGFTTTGATIFTDIEIIPHGILFWRSLTHWLGGMGIIVLSIAILPFLGVGGMQMFKAEVPGPVVDKLSPRITETAKILWGVYLLLTVAETTLLMLGGMDLFDSLCHSFGTMATGGFSTKNASVGAYNSVYIDYVIVFFMITAGMNFSLHFRMLKGSFKEIARSSEFLFYISIIAVITFLIGYEDFIYQFHNLGDSIRYALFQVVSIMTTTGFGTADYEKWSVSTNFLLFALMFIGGCAGSTGGGIKVIRIIILFKFIYNELIRLIHPQAVIIVKFGNIAVDRQVLINIAGFFMIYVFITAISTIVISFFNVDFITSLGAVAATINNIGPGFGLVGPTKNYSALPEAVKWILSFLMMLGRLEVYTVIILFSPAFWRK